MAVKQPGKAVLKLSFGALSPPIKEQLAKQKLGALASDIERWEKCREGVLMCFFSGYISEGDLDLVFRRLARDVSRRATQMSVASIHELSIEQ